MPDQKTAKPNSQDKDLLTPNLPGRINFDFPQQHMSSNYGKDNIAQGGPTQSSMISGSKKQQPELSLVTLSFKNKNAFENKLEKQG